MLEDNVRYFLDFVKTPNPQGEKITLVGASKMQNAETINAAIRAGLTDVGENRAQEFRDKLPLLSPVNYHFFGRLQSNKLKYIVGKACLIQSVDSSEIAAEISRLSEKLGVASAILLEVNLGEEQKGGVGLNAAEKLIDEISKLPCISVRGLMTVLPKLDDGDLIYRLAASVRELYDKIRPNRENFNILSMGMSADYVQAVKAGSNMIRIGTGIFGQRNYTEEK